MINYYLLTKPGIVLGNLITVAAGFILGSSGSWNLFLFLATLFGLAFIMASACVFNNYIDRRVDQKMERTKNRPLVKGLISGKNAILFGIILAVIGNGFLFAYTNVLTTFIANIGFFVYVILYSLWKCRTIYGTAIGSIAGGVPPVVGYCAAGNHFDAGALILFMILVFWQMPHFFSIAMYRFDDYISASIPVLPVIKGFQKTQRHMVIYIIGFILATAALTCFHYTGYLYLSCAVLLGVAWFVLCLKGFTVQNHRIWARSMFRLSLFIITVLCLIIPFDT
jgi:heme o synthase